MRVSFDERGSGTAVLFLHAGIADRSMWAEHLDWLAGEGFRAIAFDLPGFGEAAVADGPQAPWEDVLQTLRKLGVSRAALVGNSFGAAVALRVAVVAPAAVSALMLVSPPPLGSDDPSPELAAAWDARGDRAGARGHPRGGERRGRRVACARRPAFPPRTDCRHAASRV